MDYSRPDYNSFSRELVGAQSVQTGIPIGSKIVHIDILQSGTASNSWLDCGGYRIANNYARDSEVDLAFISTTTCLVAKTGNDTSFFTVIYSSGYPTATSSGNITDNSDIVGVLAIGFGMLCFLVGILYWQGMTRVERYG